jgi:signal peptidase I
MSPTIKTHDLTLENRLAYQKKEPQRGDIISFSAIDENGEESLHGKRVIGVPGDVVSFHDGYVYINDEKLDESDYLDEDVETNCIETFTVPDQCVFVLGDNREDSYDSRYWENPYVSYDQIVAKVVLVIPTHVFYSDED